MYYKLSCPVPKKQRPVNEYMELVQSNFFNWPLQNKVFFRNKLIKSFIFFFACFFPFSNIVYDIHQSLAKLILLNTAFAGFFIFLALLRLLLGWTYIKKRLCNPSIFYEESGWYDGRVWVKPKNILVQDRFIYTYQVFPALMKVKKTLAFLTAFLLCLLFSFVLI